MNRQIRAQTVRLIDETDEQLGIVALEKALLTAQEKSFDLVEVAPNVNPPVCKLMDYGKYLYRLEKQERKQKKAQKQTEVKGVRIGFRTGLHDLEVKARQAKKFLEDRNTVKVSLVFKGREVAYVDMAKEKMMKFFEMVQGAGKMDEPPKKQGNTLMMIIIPLK